MEKRAVLAVILSIVVFYLFSAYIAPPASKQGTAAVQKQASSAQAAPVAAAPVSSVPREVPVPPADEQTVTVETDLYKAVFSTRGAALKSLVLKKYSEKAGAKGSPVTLVDAANPSGYTLKTTGFNLDPDAQYTSGASSLTLSGGDTKELVFSRLSPDGVLVKKIYGFTGNRYAIALKHQLVSQAQPVSGTLKLLLSYHFAPTAESTRYDEHGVATYGGGKLQPTPFKNAVEKGVSVDKGVLWTGFADKYFLRAVVGAGTPIASVSTSSPAKEQLLSTVSSPPLAIPGGQAVETSYLLYLGPKDIDILKSAGYHLEEAVDLGWFSSLAKPLLQSLKFFYRYTHNYGVAIIIITIILKVLFYPLTYKSYKSMKEMQKIQPLMNKLREKYKNDRDAMNREVMKLYQEHKVNPLGGCLPMIVQIPVFFALYKALMFSIELRHAPFMLWITDLSAKDPYYVTPIIMGATMVIQQKMTPSQMDPIQQKMMMALPVVFTFMFLNFPSGLVLYWLVNNILTIGQQWQINRQIA